MVRRALTTPSIGAMLILSAGCIPFVPCYYAYPSISHVPSVDTEGGADVRAFRIDVAEKLNGIEYAALDSFVFTEVPVWPKGSVAGQTQVAVDYGMVWNCIALIFTKHTSHKVLVRLYRPGYETIEIRSCEDKVRFVWTAALDLPAQEKAVDDLVAVSKDAYVPNYLVPDGSDKPLAGLDPGSTCAAHRKALLFAASEYQRLAAKILDEREEGDATRLRLREKASRYSKRALE
jgi:hypothetical protein